MVYAIQEKPLKNLKYKKAWLKKEIKTTLNNQIETKVYDGALGGGTVVSSIGAVYPLLTDPSAAAIISQGVGDTQYIGSKIRMVGLSEIWTSVWR